MMRNAWDLMKERCRESEIEGMDDKFIDFYVLVHIRIVFGGACKSWRIAGEACGEQGRGETL
jgi:hypothetical protein